MSGSRARFGEGVGGAIVAGVIALAGAAAMVDGALGGVALASERARLERTRESLEAETEARMTAARAEREALLARIAALEADPAPVDAVPERPFLVIGVQDRSLQLWDEGKVDFKTRVAVGMGEAVIDGEVYRFDTPRGRHFVRQKEETPIWVAPDWHYLERAQKLRVDSAPVSASRPFAARDGSSIEVQGDTLARCRDGACTPYGPAEEVVVDGTLLIPPISTTQRRFPEVLGTHRLKLGGDYAIHGTNKPGSIGRAASHGCVRVRNEDIAVLYERVDVGTLVIVY